METTAPPTTQAETSGIAFRANRLRRFVAAWRALPADPLTLAWIQFGWRIPFVRVPDRCMEANAPMTKQEAEFTDQEVKNLLRTGAASRTGQGGAKRPHCVCRLRVVPKKGPKKFRLCHDTRHPNRYTGSKSVHYDDVRVLREIIRPGDFVFRFDFSSGYHHVGVRGKDRKYLGFYWDGSFYVFNVLCFGLAWAPYVFTRVVSQVIKRWRKRGVRCCAYLDDIAVCASGSFDDALALCAELLRELRDLGWVVNAEKSQLVPSQQSEFLGYAIDTARGLLSVPPSRVAALRSALRACRGPRVPARAIARVTGHLASMSLAIPWFRVMCSALFECLDPLNRTTRASWRESVDLSPAARAELRWWAGIGCAAALHGTPLWRGAARRHVFSDAGPVGWGGWCRDAEAMGFWSAEERFASTTWRELVACLYTLMALRPQLENTELLLWLDSLPAVYGLLHGRSQRDHLSAVIREIYALLAVMGCGFQVAWLRSKANWRADALSRMLGPSHSRLRPELFALLDARWGPHAVDGMAALCDTQLPCYVSELHDPAAMGTDFFAQNWHGCNVYIHPPWCLIPRVLALLREQRASATIIAPVFPARAWWPVLVAATEDVLPLPPVCQSLVSGASGYMSPVDLPSFPLAAFRVNFA